MPAQLVEAPVPKKPIPDTTHSPTPTNGRLVRKTTGELVLDELRSRILSGAFAPGVPLRQEALADELGVSRIPVREAIRLLGSEGLVDVQPHKGAFVSTISKDEVQEFFDLRLRLEPWLLQEAMPSISDAELARAERVVTSMDTATPEDWGSLNWQLHESLYSAAGRPAALAIVRGLHEKSERYFRFQAVHALIREQAHQEHLQLIDLCRHRQAEKAQLVLEKHIAEAAEQILAIIDRLVDEVSAK